VDPKIEVDKRLQKGAEDKTLKNTNFKANKPTSSLDFLIFRHWAAVVFFIYLFFKLFFILIKNNNFKEFFDVAKVAFIHRNM
jgi:hypothetical protein